jgi:alkyl sulfatase BDS1-like metallo-beta-lactamase superfamily hydrolase
MKIAQYQDEFRKGLFDWAEKWTEEKVMADKDKQSNKEMAEAMKTTYLRLRKENPQEADLIRTAMNELTANKCAKLRGGDDG